MNHMGTSVSSSVIITVRPVTGIFYILLCVVLTQYCGRGIFTKRPTIFFLSHDAYHAEYCRWTHYLVTNVYRVHTPFLYETMSVSHCNPDRVRGGRVRLELPKGARFFLCPWSR